jgi:hypothetical protein
MKQFSLNHARLAIVNSHHNLFHWLTVVFLTIVHSLIMIPFSLYTMAFGLMFSVETIHPYSPPVWLEKALFYSNQLPYYQVAKKFILTELGHWYTGALVWWAMVVGLPLLALGATLFLINFFNLYYSIFSSFYNRTHCPFCKEPIKFKKK